MTSQAKSPIKDLTLFSLPIILGQIGQTLFGLVDIAVGGRYSTEVVSALGISTSIFVIFLVFGLGISLQVGPMSAQKLKDKTLEDNFYYSSLSINLLIGFIATAIYLSIPLYFINFMGLDPKIIPLIQDYSLLISPTLLCSMFYQNNKEYLQAHELTFFPNACIIIFNILNLILNIILVFGYLGFPQLGIIGTGISTLICRIGMLIAIQIYINNKFHFKIFKFSTQYIKEISRQSLPVAMGFTAEVAMFGITTVFAGKLGILSSAAHNICLNIASTTFMVPMAMSSAVAVKVGHNYGLKNLPMMKEYMKGSLFIVIGYSILTCIAYCFFPESLLSWATKDSQVINIGISILLFVAIFQVPDAMQITLQGILRGISVTKPTMIITVSSAICCIPLSYYLGLKTSLGAKGLWLALAIALTVQTILYLRLLKNRLNVVSF